MNEEIRAIIAQQAGVAPGTIDDDTVLADLGIDSLDAVEISMYLEETFDIEFSDSEMDNIARADITFADVVRIVKGKVGE
jgi:acyl carrier protein